MWIALAMLGVGLAGCIGGDGADEVVDDVPDEITERDVRDLEALAGAQFPKRFSFPGQEALEPVLCLFEGTVSAGTGFMAPEVPNDDGPIDAGGAIIPYDLNGCSDEQDGRTLELQEGQPVELRVKLKWWGDPGSSGDLDIWVDVPGENDAYTPDRFDESMNWNIVTKFRILNTVALPGEPMQVGVQVSNGKNIHPDGIDYELSTEIVFAEDVLAPYIPYVLTVPDDATALVFESEPLVGDEHITSEFVLIDPDDQLVRSMHHNDIATETILIPVSKPGEYILYASHQHGGFLRVETDVPNEGFMVRAGEATVTRTPVYTSPGPPVPGTYVEQCVYSGAVAPQCLPVSNSFGATGGIDTGDSYPLAIFGYVDTSSGGSFDAAINITSDKGWLHTAAASMSHDDGDTRIGFQGVDRGDFRNLSNGGLQYGLVVNAGIVEVGYVVVSYQR